MTTKRPPHPGKLLKERFLDPLGITPYRLAKSIGVHVRRVSELVKGNRRLTPDTAIRLGLFFRVPPSWWLEMQARHDTEGIPKVETLGRRIKPYQGLEKVLVTPNGVRLGTACDRQRPVAETVSVPDGLVERLRRQVTGSNEAKRRRSRDAIPADGAIAMVSEEP